MSGLSPHGVAGRLLRFLRRLARDGAPVPATRKMAARLGVPHDHIGPAVVTLMRRGDVSRETRGTTDGAERRFHVASVGRWTDWGPSRVVANNGHRVDGAAVRCAACQIPLGEDGRPRLACVVPGRCPHGPVVLAAPELGSNTGCALA